MQRAQGSVEILFVLALIIILSFIIVGKFFSQQDEVFTRASARGVMVGELEKLDSKFYLVKVESVECPPSASTGNVAETRIIFFINPSPVDSATTPAKLDQRFLPIQEEIAQLVKDTTGVKNKTIQIWYNTPGNLVCGNTFSKT